MINARDADTKAYAEILDPENLLNKMD